MVVEMALELRGLYHNYVNLAPVFIGETRIGFINTVLQHRRGNWYLCSVDVHEDQKELVKAYLEL